MRHGAREYIGKVHSGREEESETMDEINREKYAERGKNKPRARSITYPPHADLESKGRLSRVCTCVCECVCV